MPILRAFSFCRHGWIVTEDMYTQIICDIALFCLFSLLCLSTTAFDPTPFYDANKKQHNNTNNNNIISTTNNAFNSIVIQACIGWQRLPSLLPCPLVSSPLPYSPMVHGPKKDIFIPTDLVLSRPFVLCITSTYTLPFFFPFLWIMTTAKGMKCQVIPWFRVLCLMLPRCGTLAKPREGNRVFFPALGVSMG